MLLPRNPMSAAIVGQMEGRPFIRCDSCKLTQFPARDKKCRKCHTSLEAAPVPIPEPVAPKPPPPIRTSLEAFPLILALIREAYGLSQRELAARLECARTWISKLENGKSGPSTATFFRISEVLDIHPVLMFQMCEAAANKPSIHLVPDRTPTPTALT